jgi:hypothetical protein
MVNKFILGLFLPVVLAGCDSKEELTCEVLDDPNFCPDGTTYESDSAKDLISCGDGSVDDSRLPGEGLVSFGISPKPLVLELGFVECEFPEATR